uniref:Uncharacterized protein n=1 Tax=Kalanchoe fedtschenkoi TaxID=63787 RepID=A0A7N0U8R9_KALFE
MEDEKWCPQAAMKAYLCTLHLCRESARGGAERSSSRSVVAEPECMEFISALAAGNGARLIVEIASKTTPLTVALAVAAKQTGGQMVCILPTQQQVERCKGYISIRYPDLKDFIKFASGDPCEAMRSLGDQNVDFAVINGEFGEHLQLLEIMRKHRGCSIVVERLERSGKGAGGGVVSSFGEAVRGREGIESVSLPVSGGMEVTRIKNTNGGNKAAAATADNHDKMGSERRRSRRRFLVTVESR